MEQFTRREHDLLNAIGELMSDNKEQVAKLEQQIEDLEAKVGLFESDNNFYRDWARSAQKKLEGKQ